MKVDVPLNKKTKSNLFWDSILFDIKLNGEAPVLVLCIV